MNFGTITSDWARRVVGNCNIWDETGVLNDVVRSGCETPTEQNSRENDGSFSLTHCILEELSPLIIGCYRSSLNFVERGWQPYRRCLKGNAWPVWCLCLGGLPECGFPDFLHAPMLLKRLLKPPLASPVCESWIPFLYSSQDSCH